MTVLMKAFITTQNKLPELPVVDGQLIFVRDTKTIYLDFGGLRLNYSTASGEGGGDASSSIFQIVETDADRLAITSPEVGFYYVEDTAKFWRYKDGWIAITASEDSNFIGDYNDFPEVGNPNMLYVSEDSIYRWDAATSEYVTVSGQMGWTVL